MTDPEPQDRDLETERPTRGQAPGGGSSRGPEVPPIAGGGEDADASNAAQPDRVQDDKPLGDHDDRGE